MYRPSVDPCTGMLLGGWCFSLPFHEPTVPAGSGVMVLSPGIWGWCILCVESDIWGTYSPFVNCLQVLSCSVKPEETLRLGKDVSGMVMIMSGSGRQSPRQRPECIMAIRCWDFNIWKKLGKKACLGRPCCCSSFRDKQLNCLHVLLGGKPNPCSLAPALSYIILLEAATSGNSRRSCQGNSGSWCQICRVFAPYFRTRFWETQIFLCLQLKFLFKPCLISGSAKLLRVLWSRSLFLTEVLQGSQNLVC